MEDNIFELDRNINLAPFLQETVQTGKHFYRQVRYMPSPKQILNQKLAHDPIFFSVAKIDLFSDCNAMEADNLKSEARYLRQQTMLCFAS